MIHALNRRVFRFSLRTLFVMALACCIALGWLAWQVRIVRHQQVTLGQGVTLSVALVAAAILMLILFRRPAHDRP
jgi:hypothetical protein